MVPVKVPLWMQWTFLTGDVSRMKPGTKRHQTKRTRTPHKGRCKDCWVKATIEIPDVSEPVEIKRVMDKPRNWSVMMRR